MARWKRTCVMIAPLVLVLALAPTAIAPAAATTAPTSFVAAAGSGGTLSDVVVSGGFAYATNPSLNEVEVLSLATGSVQPPIFVGSQPRGLDVSMDGKTLYVANSGANDISVVDLALRHEVRRITVPNYSGMNDRPFSIAVADNGTALVTTTFAGSGYGGRMLQVDLATGTATLRSDFSSFGNTTQATRVKASGDRSHIGVMVGDDSLGSLFLYTSASDSFAEKSLGGFYSYVALDGTGSTTFVTPGGLLLDHNLHLRATVGDGGLGGALTSTGAVAYRVQPDAVDVIDVARGLVTASAPLPEPVGSGSGMLALTPDGLTLVALTASGFSVVPVSTAVPLPACSAPPGVFPVVPVCGGPLADVVADSTGHAYATNPARNEVEVVSLTTGAKEAPIFVGSKPMGLDLSPDGTKLYVANSGADDVSVVDLGLRREVGRIYVPSGFPSDRPFSVAVANNGKAFVATTFSGSGFGGSVDQIDLASQTASPRTDFFHGGLTTEATRVRSSGDHSKIAVVAGDVSSGPIALYDAATDSFSPEKDLGTYLSRVGLDRTGSNVLVSPGTYLLDGSLVLRATISGPAYQPRGVAVSPDGDTGYRVTDASVEVLDLTRALQVGTIPLPEPIDTFQGGDVAITPDGTTLAVVTPSGLSVVSTGHATLSMPYTAWTEPSAAPLDGVGTWIGVAVDPVASPTQLASSYVLGTAFTFAGSSAKGSVSLISSPIGRFAMFTITGDDGLTHTVGAAFPWHSGFYFPFVYQLSPGQWGAWVYDLTASLWTPIGVLAVPVSSGKLSPNTVTLAGWYGAPAPICRDYPAADVFFYPPTGYLGGTPETAVAPASDVIGGDCPAQTSMYGAWARYQFAGA